jgi:hypothetical protein
MYKTVVLLTIQIKLYDVLKIIRVSEATLYKV